MLKLLTNENSSEIDLVSLSLDEIARLGAKKLLTQAFEVNEYMAYNERSCHRPQSVVYMCLPDSYSIKRNALSHINVDCSVWIDVRIE